MVYSTARRLMTGSAPGSPRQTGTGAGVGLGVLVVGGTGAEHLAAGVELDVDLEADDGFVLHGASHVC